MTGVNSRRAGRPPGLRYVAIADDLRRRIESEELKDGERLPSQPSLARQYGVSLTTFRTAVRLLQTEGYLRSEHGLGTFVSSPGATPFRALVVDDDPATVRLLRTILAEEGVEGIGASSGTEGRDRAAQGDFDIIFLDLVMPDIDGVQLLSQFRDMQLSTPVVLVTGEADAEMIARAMALGPVTLIIKPVRPPQVRELLQSLLPGRTATPAPASERNR